MRSKLLSIAIGLVFGTAFGASPAELPETTAADPALALLKHARIWEGYNRPDLARMLLEKLFRIAPDYPDGLAEMALLEIRVGQPDAARKLLARLRQVQPEHPAVAQIGTLLPPAAAGTASGASAAKPPVPNAAAPARRAAAPLPETTSSDPALALLKHARMWEGHNRPDLARESLEKLFLIAPDYPDGLAEMAFLDIRMDQPDAARKSLARLRQVQPEHPAIVQIGTLLRLGGSDKAKLRQARLLAHSGRTEAALAAFKALFPDGPPDRDLALEYWQLVANTTNGWEAARRGLSKLARDYPDNPRYRLALAEHETSRLPLNRQALRVIVELSKLPDYARDARAAWRRAVLRLDGGSASISLLREYLAQDQSDTAVRLRLESFVQAEEAHRRLMADPAYRAEIDGLALLDGGKIDAAEDRLNQALAGRPKDADAVGGMGLVRLRQGHHAEALAYFLQALQLDPARRRKWAPLVEAAKFWGLMRESSDARDGGEYDLAERKLRQAMHLDPHEPNAIAALANLQADQGQLAEAEKTYLQALLIEPVNRSALSGLISLYLRQGRNTDARNKIAALSPAQRNALGHSLNALQAGMMRDEADKLLAEGHVDDATAVLARAVETDADDPWLRFALARLYARQGMKAKGQTLFDELLARHPNDAPTLYALALYQSGQDENRPALATLERVAEAERTVKMTDLQRDLWLRVEGQRAKALAQAGQLVAARRILTHAEESVAGDAELSTEVALEWADLGDTQRARSLLDRLAGTTPLPASWHLRHAAFLNRIRAEPELQAELGKIAAAGKLSAEDARTLADLRESAAIRAAEALRRAGQPEAAHRTLAPLLSAAPDRIPLRYAEASILLAEHRLDAAETEYRRILAQNPQEADARDGLIDTLIQAGKRIEALGVVEQQLAQAKPGDLDTRLAMAGYLIDLDEYPRARAETDALLVAAPNNSRVLAYAGQLARRDGRLDEAIGYLQRSLAAEQLGLAGKAPLSVVRRVASAGKKPQLVVDPAPAEAAAEARAGSTYQYRRLAEMLDQRSTWLSSAVDWRSRAGTEGVSQLDSWEIPVEWKSPRGAEEQMIFRADAVRIGAGTLNLADTAATKSFGSLLLCQPNCPTGLIRQEAGGASFTVGYQRDDLQADVGTTPLGFPVWHLVGGIRKKGDLGPFSYSAEASRRPVTSSLLSFAGARDPRTGMVWGGVVATGARLGLSLDQGGTLGAWSSLGFHKLTGENVQSNDRVQLMAGGYWRVINEDDRLFTLGLTGIYWRFKEDAGEYTFGHGGYYSPQKYRSLSFPITFGQRFPRFSYVLRAAVSTSQSQFNDAPYYPTDSAIQAQAGNPQYNASSGPGKGHGVSAAFEYQLDPKLFLGGRLELERSDYYAPNRLLFYLRYDLDHIAAQPVLLPPEPVIPTSQF
ncbi:MAG: BCSC C-terminal domain-containing protein [Sulfuricellaceae bacterium]|nr:BCSC C-terminal domain-containing protein [Sulfuricellaceae bacterium]